MRTVILGLVVVGWAVWIQCNGNQLPQNLSKPLVEVVNPTERDTICSGSTCCGKHWSATVIFSPDTGKYYVQMVLASTKDTSIIKYGSNDYVFAGDTSAYVELLVTYLDSIPSGDYLLLWTRIARPSPVSSVDPTPKLAEATLIQQVSTSSVYVPQFSSNCLSIMGASCTELQPNGRAGGAQRPGATPAIFGVRAKIYTSYGNSVCSALSQTDRMSFGLVGMAVWRDTNAALGNSIWANAGYGRYRSFDRTGEYFCKFFEVEPDSNSPTYQNVQWSQNHDPDEWKFEWNVYSIQLDTASGMWKASYNSTIFDSVAFPIWQGTLGKEVSFFGEVCHVEDKMPGSSANPVKATQMYWYRKSDSIRVEFATLQNGILFSLDKGKWSSDTSTTGDTLKIWDRNP